MRLRGLTALAVLALVVPVAPASAQSQAINGTIEGTVKDAQGGVLPGVTVTITHLETNAPRVVVSNESGTYRAPLLPLGTFSVAWELAGFGRQERSGVTLTAGQTVVLNVSLGVGGVAETLVVTADVPPVDLAKTDVGRNLNEREIKNLPLVSRNPYNFALLEGGVTGFENEEFGVPRFAVNGQMLRINYQIDGNTNTQKDRAGLRLLPMSEVMIGEVQIVSSGYAPEFGQTTGMVYNAVTPSGTNRLRGDVGYRFRRKSFSAWPFGVTAEERQNEDNKPDNSLDIFTATVGGPLISNRLFYYVGTERTYQDLSNPVNQTARDLAPVVGIAQQPVTVPASRAAFFLIGKGDYQINPSHRLSVRMNNFRNDNPYQSGGGQTAIERGNDFADVMYSTAGQVISTLGPSRLNELRLQYAQRHTQRFSHDPTVVGPSVTITGNISFGPPTNDREDFQQRISQVIDNFTWLRGSHSFKTGFDLQWVDDHRAVPLPTTYTFPTVQAYLDAKSGLNPRGYSNYSQTIGEPNFDMNNSLLSLFGQDDWRLTPDLKVLYGLRYDYYMYPSGIEGSPYSQTFNRDKNNVSPRVGFAWTMGQDRKMVLRGNTGLMYDQPLLAIVERSYANSGFPSRFSVSLPASNAFAPDFPGNLDAVPPGTALTQSTVEAMDPDFVTARTWQNSLTLERGFGENYSASIGVRYARGWDMPVVTDINLAGITPVRFLEDGRGVYSGSVNANTRNDPRFNRIRVYQSIGESEYTGATMQVNKRWSGGAQFSLNYTVGKGEDTAPLGGNVIAVQGDAGRSDPVDLERDRGPNQLDIRHTFNGSIVAISSVQRFSPMVNSILSDNQVGVIMQFNSGQPDTVAGNRDLNGDGVNNDRPLFVARNSMYVPTRWNMDLRYSRFFALGGNRRFELQAEFKNVFNTEQISAVDNTLEVDTDGHPVQPGTLVRVPLSSISLAGSDYEATNWREQRKFQLGFKFFF
jgi:hypothetical protein